MRAPINNPYRVTLKYGATTSPYSASNPHNGVDLASDDKLIVAPEDGTVTYYADTKGKSGWMMVLQGSYRHSFSHTVAGSNKVPVGSKVKAGQPLAVMGQTGFASGVHVHWVVNSGSIDPLSLIKGGGMEERIKQLEASEQRLAAEVVARDKALAGRDQRIKDLEASEQRLAQEVVARDKKIASLESQVGDNSKFETLKALLRELFGIR